MYILYMCVRIIRVNNHNKFYRPFYNIYKHITDVISYNAFQSHSLNHNKLIFVQSVVYDINKYSTRIISVYSCGFALISCLIPC